MEPVKEEENTPIIAKKRVIIAIPGNNFSSKFLINWTNTIALEQLNAMAANLAARGVDGETGALAQMAARLHGQAAVMSFIDIFTLITALFGGLALAALLMRPAASGGGSGH